VVAGDGLHIRPITAFSRLVWLSVGLGLLNASGGFLRLRSCGRIEVSPLLGVSSDTIRTCPRQNGTDVLFERDRHVVELENRIRELEADKVLLKPSDIQSENIHML